MKKTILFLLAILILSIFSWRVLVKPGYSSMHDDMQIMRIFELDKCFRDGQIPCRWVPDLGYSYGYPLFNYYPPLPYYLGELFYLLGFSLINSVKLLFVLGFILSGFFMFFLAREFWGDLGGLLAAIFYIYAPYHAVDVYVRGAMGEHWALVWFPLILLSVYKVIKEKSWWWVFLLATSYGFLLLSHNIMSMLFSVAALAWGVIWLFLTRDYKKIIRLGIGVIWAIFLSAFFLLPVIFEKKFAHTETMFMGYFNYLAHFVNLEQLFIKTDWYWGASVYGPEDMMPFMIGILHWPLVIINVILAFFFWRKKKTLPLLVVIGFLTLFFFASAFMTHERSTPIWQKIKILEYLQFPWRFLGLVIFFASFSAGAIVMFFKNRKINFLLCCLLLVACCLSYKDYFQPERYYDVTDEDRLTGEQWELALTNAIFDYLPIYAGMPPAEEAPELPQLVSGEGEVINFQKGTDWQKFDLEVDEEAVIRLSLYDFPGWTVWVDDEKAETNHDNLLGLITFEVSPGEHQVRAQLLNTPVRNLGNFMSLIGFLGLAGGIVILKKKLSLGEIRRSRSVAKALKCRRLGVGG